MNISLVRFNKAIDMSMIDCLKDGWDWPLSDCDTLESFVKKVYNDSEIAYWVFKDSKSVGVLEFCEYSEKDVKSLVGIGLFLHKEYRGMGVAEILLHSSVESFYRLGLDSIATVHVNNGRSLSLIRKATGLSGMKVFEANRNRYAWVFDFSVEKLDTSLASDSIINTIVADDFTLRSITE